MRVIIKVDSKGKKVKRYDSKHSLVLDGLNYNGVYKCATGIRNTYKGQKFFFEDEYVGIDDSYKVICLNKDATIVKEYDRIEDVKYDNFWASSVSESIRLSGKKTRFHKGFYWCYKKDLESVIEEIESNFIYQYEIDGSLVAKYVDINHAVENGYTKSSIYHCLNGNYITHAGCIWKRKCS